ncbi:CHAT domain-containing protein [Podospora didyma]|uniref:CHAT domain-containing protein n=1 Tax=Podospora didyma TaxID=330526 RepID=A0AAE0P0L4_9PEZI|nr:CHAT domain-containing protein [Podospora didyma]
MELFSIEAETASLLKDMSNEELCSFAELHDDPAIGGQIELYIYTCFLLFKKSVSTEHLERAAQRAEGWVAVTPTDHPDRIRRSRIFDMMSACVHHRSIPESTILTTPGVTQRMGEEPAVDEIGIQIRHLSHQAERLAESYQQTGRLEDLREAVTIMELALELGGAHIEPRMLSNLGAMLGMRFDRTGSIDDLNRAVDIASRAVDTTPQDHPDRAAILSSLGNSLGTRFQRTGSIDDLNRAVDVTSIAVDITLQDHPDRTTILSGLGYWLGTRFQRTGSIDDLNRAVDIASRAVDTTPQDHPHRAAILNNLGNWLGTRFQRTGSIDDVNRAVDIASIAVDTTPQDHPDRAGRLNNLGAMLGTRFQRTGSIDDLNRAVDVASIAVDTTPQDHPGRADILNSLGNWLGTRFDRTGSIDDLNRAVNFASIAVDTTPQDHPDRASRLNNLGNWLGMRFQRTGSIDDLNRAVDVASMAVDTTPQDHPDRTSRLNNLGNCLDIRFQRTGSIDDLNRAIDVASIAVDTTPQDHPDRARWLNNLGNCLDMRFQRTGSIDDLNRAIDVASRAVDTTPQDHPDRAAILSNLGNRLGKRFQRTGSIDDLNRAVNFASIAVDTTPQDHPDRASRLNNLGNWLGTRFQRTGSIDDVNRAVNVASIAVDTTPQDHPNRAGRLNNLGNWLGMRFERTGSIDDLNCGLSSYKEGWSCHTAPPSVHIRLARATANILALQREWGESSQLLEEAVKLLPTVSPRSLNHTDKQHMLAESAGLASVAAAAALNAGKAASHALQLLELGRGVIASLLMDMRGDISDLKREHPGLADEFTSLRDELDSPSDRLTPTISNDSTSSWESQAKRRREADQKFGELIAGIRTRPGFERFLLPPAEDEIMAAADPDPIVVVNLSSYRCDAFMVEHNQITVLELPGLKMEEVQERAQDLRSSRATGSFHITPLLGWLWDSVAHPTLNALGFNDPVSDDKWRRVWWIPTGLLSQLPLHAAGLHMRGSTETVLDRVMSSYAPSIKALIHGRRVPIRESAGPFTDYALLVAMRETPGLATSRILPFAGDEVEMLKSLCRSLKLGSLTPIMRKDNVLQHLQTCKIFHFAGHGQADPADPSQSCLLLEDWKTSPLTVGDLRDHRLQGNGPFLGYLSACSTGSNEAVRLADEGIHLVSAFQLAGFRHVIGTLWEVSDRHCVDVARVLYETLRDEGMTDIAVCRGLHRAVRALRNEGIKDEKEKDGKARDATLEFSGSRVHEMANPHWVPYIHFGV